MKFLWPEYLWLLIAAPLMIWAYVAILRRNRRSIRYANVGLVKEALGNRRQWRRHVPPVLFLLAIVAALLAVARPTALVTLPSERRMIVMAMDVSLSMRATDVQPSRMLAAQAAAKSFVQDVPEDLKIGIVTFAGTAALVQAPTRNREDLIAAIDRFEMQRHTAIGSGIIVSLATIFPDAGINLESAIFGRAFASGQTKKGAPIERGPSTDKKAEIQEFKPVAPGSYNSAAIILLTDGRRTTGPDTIEAARMAADRGVKVHTVGFGSAAGGAVNMDGYSMFMMFDEATLKTIAAVTKGEYFHAATAADLKKVYEALNHKFSMERTETEITALMAALAALLAVVAGVFSVLWFNRV